MEPKQLYFIRHGEAGYNLLDRVNCHPEVANDLTVTGREQAACCRADMSRDPIEVIYCSEFPRARQTAEIINRQFGVPLVVDPLLNETGAYAFEGKPASAWHRAQVPDRLRAAVPGCETFGEMKGRLSLFLERLRAAPQRHIAVVSHEEPIQVMAGLLQGVPDETALGQAVSHCFPIRLTLPG